MSVLKGCVYKDNYSIISYQQAQLDHPKCLFDIKKNLLNHHLPYAKANCYIYNDTSWQNISLKSKRAVRLPKIYQNMITFCVNENGLL